jgi:hypothetical protein
MVRLSTLIYSGYIDIWYIYIILYYIYIHILYIYILYYTFICSGLSMNSTTFCDYWWLVRLSSWYMGLLMWKPYKTMRIPHLWQPPSSGFNKVGIYILHYLWFI